MTERPVCASQGCDTILSRYNPDAYCSVCERKRATQRMKEDAAGLAAKRWWPLTYAEPEGEWPRPCPDCGRNCASERSLEAHRAKAHPVVGHMRRYGRIVRVDL